MRSYQEITSEQRAIVRKMRDDGVVFQWKEKDELNFIKGGLPSVHLFSMKDDPELENEYVVIRRMMHNYDFFDNQPDTLQAALKECVRRVRNIHDNKQEEFDELKAHGASDETVKRKARKKGNAKKAIDRAKMWIDLHRLDSVVNKVETALGMHKACLISGQGGIGKSRFMAEFEKELHRKKAEHFCAYGKHFQDVSEIDVNGIVSVGQEKTFVFMFDAINEIKEDQQKLLLEIVRKLKDVRGVRIILTYRSFTMNKEIEKGFKDVLGCEYVFPGVDFSSAINWLASVPVEYLDEYINILYSNNPLILRGLKGICEKLKGKQKAILENEVKQISKSEETKNKKDETLDNVHSITHILEHIITDGILKEHNGDAFWEYTKDVVEFLYKKCKRKKTRCKHNKKKWKKSKSNKQKQKQLTLREIREAIAKGHALKKETVKNASIGVEKYVQMMIECGFMVCSENNGQTHYKIAPDLLGDYLIARSLQKELSDVKKKEKTECGKEQKCAAVINERKGEFSNFDVGAFVVALFDSFSPMKRNKVNYKSVRAILEKSRLIGLLDSQSEILQKIHFRPGWWESFLEVFPAKDKDPERLLVNYAGYLNHPYNCTNFLHKHLVGLKEKQKTCVKDARAKINNPAKLVRRLGNMIYLHLYLNMTDQRLGEYHLTAMWSLGECDPEVRMMALKLLFDILQSHDEFIGKTIALFPEIHDEFVREGVVYVLSRFDGHERVTEFFEELWRDREFVLAKSLGRIARYLGRNKQYIQLDKRNLFAEAVPHKEASKDFKDFLHLISVFRNGVLPVRGNPFRRPFIEHSVMFMNIDKEAITAFGKVSKNAVTKLNEDKKYRIECESFLRNCEIEPEDFWYAFEQTFNRVAGEYGLEVNYEKFKFQSRASSGFSRTLLAKCLTIAVERFWGSMMCNYYVNFNWDRKFDLYESCVHDPLKVYDHGDADIDIQTPLSVFQNDVERMDAIIVDRAIIGDVRRDEEWAHDVGENEKHLRELLQPFEFEFKTVESGEETDDTKTKGRGKNGNGQMVDCDEWQLLACRIRIEDPGKDVNWREEICIHACCSSKRSLKRMTKDEARHAAIDIPRYVGLVGKYATNSKGSEFCAMLPTIRYERNVLHDMNCTFPPSVLVRGFELKFDEKKAAWVDAKGIRIIQCNTNCLMRRNNRIIGSVYIRKAALDLFVEECPGVFKYVAYAEKSLGLDVSMMVVDDSMRFFELNADGEVVWSST